MVVLQLDGTLVISRQLMWQVGSRVTYNYCVSTKIVDIINITQVIILWIIWKYKRTKAVKKWIQAARIGFGLQET